MTTAAATPEKIRLIVSVDDDRSEHGAGVAYDFVRHLQAEQSGAGESCSPLPLFLLTSENACPDSAVAGPGNVGSAIRQFSVDHFLQSDWLDQYHPAEVVLFAGTKISQSLLLVLQQLATAGRRDSLVCIIVLDTIATHLDDPAAQHAEHVLCSTLRSQQLKLVLLRTGFLLTQTSGMSTKCRRYSGCWRLFPAFLSSTFVEGEELWSVIEQELKDSGQSDFAAGVSLENLRAITLLGRRLAWRDLLRYQIMPTPGWFQKIIAAFTVVMAFIGIPRLLGAGLLVAAKFRPSARRFCFRTLRPRSTAELLSLYNRHNCRHVQIAGYNNGVNHFGWKFPDQTVVLTTGIPGRIRISDRHVTVDAGVTLKQSIHELNAADREFLVVPNYSWISMGTLYFVPVHGSGSAVSTLGDTIEQVLLFDAEREQFVSVKRQQNLFREFMYDRDRHLLLLRLKLRIRERSQYFVRRSVVESPSASEVLALLQDTEASHVEIRKNRAASHAIDVSRYFSEVKSESADCMQVPRDAIGRTWDRLEETPVVSYLFHWFVRTFAFHVELFMKPDEFVTFWKHHQRLPVSKIQLRRVLRDGIHHSACRDQDCISADLFMTRKYRHVFSEFIRRHLPDVRTNPGKQSL